MYWNEELHISSKHINLTPTPPQCSIPWKESSVGVVDASRIYLRTDMAVDDFRAPISWTEGLDFPEMESANLPALSCSLFGEKASAGERCLLQGCGSL